jgi:hypothetical protein
MATDVASTSMGKALGSWFSPGWIGKFNSGAQRSARELEDSLSGTKNMRLARGFEGTAELQGHGGNGHARRPLLAVPSAAD